MNSDSTDTGAQAEAGTQEFAASAHEGIVKRVERMKEQMGNGADLLTIIWSVAYDNREGLIHGMDGEPNSVIETMAVGILKLADLMQERIASSEKFLPEKNRTPYVRIVSNIETQLMMALKHMTQDRINAEKDAHIIVPRMDDGLIRPPASLLTDAPPDLEKSIKRAVRGADRTEGKLKR